MAVIKAASFPSKSVIEMSDSRTKTFLVFFSCVTGVKHLPTFHRKLPLWHQKLICNLKPKAAGPQVYNKHFRLTNYTLDDHVRIKGKFQSRSVITTGKFVTFGIILPRLLEFSTQFYQFTDDFNLINFWFESEG